MDYEIIKNEIEQIDNLFDYQYVMKLLEKCENKIVVKKLLCYNHNNFTAINLNYGSDNIGIFKFDCSISNGNELYRLIYEPSETIEYQFEVKIYKDGVLSWESGNISAYSIMNVFDYSPIYFNTNINDELLPILKVFKFFWNKLKEII